MKATSVPATVWLKKQEQFLRNIAPDSHFHIVFEALPGVHFFVKNRAGQVMLVSKGLLAHFGFQDESQILGKTDQELVAEPYAAKYMADDALVYQSGKPLMHRVELWVDCVGLPNWYVTSKFPLRTHNGEIIGIMGILQSSENTAPGSPESAKIASAVAMLRDSLDSFPGANTLARACHLSVRQLQRLFSATFGMSPRAYWIKTRVRAACERLRGNRESLVEIAASLGFTDQSSFTRQFRKHTGLTPNAYRRHGSL